jgi:hypothetical protein
MNHTSLIKMMLLCCNSCALDLCLAAIGILQDVLGALSGGLVDLMPPLIIS